MVHLLHDLNLHAELRDLNWRRCTASSGPKVRSFFSSPVRLLPAQLISPQMGLHNWRILKVRSAQIWKQRCLMLGSAISGFLLALVVERSPPRLRAHLVLTLEPGLLDGLHRAHRAGDLVHTLRHHAVGPGADGLALDVVFLGSQSTANLPIRK